MALPVRDITELLSELRRTRTLVTPEELAHRLPPTLPTGLEELDRLLGGGLPQGRIVELGEGQGALGTAISLQILARFTSRGRLAALIDRADAFDPPSAAQAGVALERVLWCRPTTHKEAVRAADALLASGAFALVILDLGPAPRRSRRGPWGAASFREGARVHGGAAGPGPIPFRREARSHVGVVGAGVAPLGKGARALPGAMEPEAASPGEAGRTHGGAAIQAELQLVRTAPGEGAPPDEPRLERYAVRRRRSDPADDTISQAAWLRLARDAESARASLLVLGGEGAGTFAAATLRPLRVRPLFLGAGPGRTFEGLDLTLSLERNKLGLSPGEARLSFRAPELFPTGQRDPLPGAARIGDDPAASLRKAWRLPGGELPLPTADEEAP